MKNLFYKNYFSVVTPSTGSNEIFKNKYCGLLKKIVIIDLVEKYPFDNEGCGTRRAGVGIWDLGGRRPGGKGVGITITSDRKCVDDFVWHCFVFIVYDLVITACKIIR